MVPSKRNNIFWNVYCNIKNIIYFSYGHNVRFAVIRNSREIIVSWCDTFAKPIKTLVRSYELAPDFQTISSVKEMESVHHYISSLHNIHGMIWPLI